MLIKFWRLPAYNPNIGVFQALLFVAAYRLATFHRRINAGAGRMAG
ncbi:hypothetical protein H2Y56_03825 [Pectobacterium aroidearum]|uniref:Uncharacterized protein n=1 Tax=Pectobacterium aroidearum TaxID=1201031 RepID=A0ABR5Z9J1_9GAMM|nr:MULTISPECIES: hypothetical protein [Pectobacterium]MBA5198453.1 hypothetical protein [Pectobacterium aroidearum]MBA5227042.1 hypothetical protein [Pectobacterium aroidearum]MBA5231246.1 hypothetical protein [Pectobacterium aroidearum]MBA5235636.1 hypothetical protein [Pectobacterium aroidearum]MBA5736393.1 hypothetical protein [Pectobacterium aroidearum]